MTDNFRYMVYSTLLTEQKVTTLHVQNKVLERVFLLIIKATKKA